MKVITWVNLEGVYIVTSPAYNDGMRPIGETEEECLERVWARLVAVGGYGIPIDHPHHYIDDSVQEAKLVECCGRHFRDAWEMDTDGTPKVNMPKARGIQMDKIRAVRNKELAKKDVEFMKALEADDGSSTVIATEKQALRDIPQTFDLTTDTADELKEKWPEGLPKE